MTIRGIIDAWPGDAARGIESVVWCKLHGGFISDLRQIEPRAHNAWQVPQRSDTLPRPWTRACPDTPPDPGVSKGRLLTDAA
jgi:hypothetical protein